MISPQKYNKLSLEDQGWYKPVYGEYKQVKVEDYCDECGHSDGFHYEEEPIGNPISYKKLSFSDYAIKKVSMQSAEWMLKRLSQPNFLLDGSLKGKTVVWKRYDDSHSRPEDNRQGSASV